MTTASFADEEFGSARLGDARNDKRLLKMARQAAISPAGKITEVFKGSRAEREAAFRLVENGDVSAEEVIRASARAGFERVKNEAFVFVPVDGTSLTLSGVPGDSEMGPVGNRWSREIGAHVMNAIIVNASGVTMGSAGQVYWTRERQEQLSRSKTYAVGKKPQRTIRAKNRPVAEKEISHWGTCIENAIESSRAAGFKGELWFQLDAGADFSHMLSSATLMSQWVTVRTKRDRRIHEEEHLLMEEVLRSAPVGTYTIDVPETNNRPGRKATLEVRYAPVILHLKPRGDGGTHPAPLFAVHAREISKVPKNGTALDWMLLTNKPGHTRAAAIEVIEGYTTRWRIEEVHKSWKSATRVEESSLQTLHALSLWAGILFAVAIRIERLKYFSRENPDVPATVELSSNEIRVLCAFRKNLDAAATLTIKTAVRWIADMGGYMNPHQGPPGTIVLARGLENLRSKVDALEAMRDLKL
jgi:Transposase DNA-binding/Transposase DDE domain